MQPRAGLRDAQKSCWELREVLDAKLKAAMVPPCTTISTQTAPGAGQTDWGPRSVQQEAAHQKMQPLDSSGLSNSWLYCTLELGPAVIRCSCYGSAFGTRLYPAIR